MSKTHTQNVLALSVAALVASGVAAFAGVATFNNDLAGKAVNLAQGEMCPGGCPSNQWCNYQTHSCQAFDTSGGTSGGMSGGTSTSTTTSTTTSPTSGPVGLNCAGGSLDACQKTCVKDGITNTFCTGYCAKECPSTSTTSTSTTVTVANRCAYVAEGDGCMAKCTCYVENTSSCSGTPKSDEVAFCNAVKGADSAKTGKTGVFNMTTCSNYCDELKAVPPPAPVVEEPAPTAPAETPAEPVSTRPIIEPAHTAAPVFEDNFEDQGDFDGGDDDFDGFDGDSRGGFHGGPGDFDEDFDMGFGGPDDFGGDEEFMQAMMNQYGGDFSFEEGDFSGYFGDFGPGMGGEFGGDFGDDFGGMPLWIEDELENTKNMMRGMAEDACQEFVEEIDDAESFEELEDIGWRMQEECMGGDMGGGPPDPEMMENAVKMLGIFADKEGPVYFALDVAKKHGVFTAGAVKEIEGILEQLGEKAVEAEEVCSDLPDMDEGDFFGLRGLLAQLFDDEEEGEEDEEFEEDDEDSEGFFDGGDEGGFGGDEIRQAFEACGSILDEALGAGPGQDEEEMGSGLMGELEGLMREPMEAAVENGTIPQEEWDEVEDQFNTIMEELGFEDVLDEGPVEDFEDEGEDVVSEGEDVESEGENSVDEEDFDF